MTVTRTELAHHIEAAFTAGAATLDSLLAHAASSHARPEIIAVVRGLPHTAYPSLRDLWHHLSELPVDR